MTVDPTPGTETRATGHHVWWEPFCHVLEELALAAVIVVGHGLLVRLIIFVISTTASALEKGHDGHEPTVFGVTARYLIEGGEIILVGIVLTLGILSAFLTLGLGLWRRFRRQS